MNKLIFTLTLLTALTFLTLPMAQANHYTTSHEYEQRNWYDSHTQHHNQHYYGSYGNYRSRYTGYTRGNVYIPSQHYYHYTPPRTITINPHHTQALCQHQCATTQSNNRPYVVITNQYASQPPRTTYANVHHQYRVVQTPQPPRRSTQSTIYVPW